MNRLTPTGAHRMRNLLAALLAGLVTLAPHAFADDTGEWRESLNGPWAFTTNAAAVDAPDAPWDTITVPGNWDTLPAYSTHVGKGWYRREFAVPADWRGRRIRLRFEAVYHDATVWLNGSELGSHDGGYTPFEFDVTERVRIGASNTVTVCADNTYRRGAWWHWGGISRDVALIANQDARILSQHIRSEPDLRAGTARVFVRYRVTNASERALNIDIASSIDGKPEAALTARRSLPARASALIELATTLPKERVRLWHFDHPHLSRLVTRLTGAGRVLHEKSDRFGIRKVELTSDSLLLNGERVRLCGYNRVSDSPTHGNTEPDALVRGDVDLMKRANGNLTRLMHYPQAPNLLDYLDEKGMLIWGEVPVWGKDDPEVKSLGVRARQWMAEMIERDYNHPCIIGWSAGNELENHREYVEGMQSFMRTLDPHRIITHVSYTGARTNYGPENDPISASPVILYNTYGINRGISGKLHSKWPDKPIFYSEFGMKQFGADLTNSIGGIEHMHHALTEGHPYVFGVSLWTFNDYRSSYRGTPASGNREWGIVDVQRRPKAAYAQLRKLYSPVRSLSITNGFIRVEPRRPDDVPSFTLRGYRLKWNGGEIPLPDLVPGAPVWTSPQPVPPGTVVQLVTPTGYDVADTE